MTVPWGGMNPEPAPRTRIGNAERDRVAHVLKEALADGQLSITEFDGRSRTLYQATYLDELPALTADLSPVGYQTSASVVRQSPGDVAVPQQHTPACVTGEPGGVATSFAVMGGVEHHGDWLIAPSHLSIALMGGTDLNLQRARFSSAHTSIRVAAVMGGVRVVVPEDIRVKSEGAAIMGGFGIVDHPSVTVPQSELPANAPTITISGFALMGGVEVIRAARDAKLD